MASSRTVILNLIVKFEYENDPSSAPTQEECKSALKNFVETGLGIATQQNSKLVIEDYRFSIDTISVG